MTSHTSLGQFVRARRSQSAPLGESVGVRRVRGLRREEVAVRAGVSIDYYTRIEQDRVGRPSPSVLSSIATALNLDAASRSHLDRLGADRIPVAEAPPQAQAVDEALSRVLTSMRDTPAVVIGRRLELLAVNDGAAKLFGIPAGTQRVDLVRQHFLLSPHDQPGWDLCAEQQVGRLQFEAAYFPDDLVLEDLIGQLRSSDGDFERLWVRHPVDEGTVGVKVLPSPGGGSKLVPFNTVSSTSEAGQRLLMHA